MRLVGTTDKLLARSTCEIQKKSTLTKHRKRCVARLFAIIPDRIVGVFQKSRSTVGEICTEKPCARYGKLSVVANATVKSSIKKFLRRSKFSVRKRNLPSAPCLEIGIFLVVPGIGHVEDNRIAVFKNLKAWNRGTFDAKFHKI
nr:hypothetical protein [Fibrobacter intestinalis]